MTWKGTISSLLFTMSCSGITPRLNQLPRHRNTLIWFFSSQLASSITAVCEKKTTKHHHLSLFNVKSEQLHVLQLKVYIMLRCCNILFSTCFYRVFYFLYARILVHVLYYQCSWLYANMVIVI